MLGSRSIHLILKGGLGNQLFQFFAGWYFSKSVEKDLVLNISSYRFTRESEFYRSFELSKLAVANHQKKSTSNFPVLIANLHQKSNWLNKANLVARNYNDLANSKGVPIILDGYFQEAEPIIEHESQILNFLTNVDVVPLPKTLLSKVDTGPRSCIHLRLGDYLHLQDFKVLSRNFIEEALNFISRVNSSENIFLLTDSPGKVVEVYGDLFSDKKFKMIDSRRLDPFQLMRTMSDFDNLVISKSSLGWWGGFLATQNGKMVIAPANLREPEIGNFTSKQILNKWHTFNN